MTPGEDDGEKRIGDDQEIRGGDTAIRTEDSFHEALQSLVTKASENGVDIRGSWPVSGSESHASWDIEITRITRRSKFQISEQDDPVLAIVDAVAARENVDTTELSPLYDAIDPEILNILKKSSPENKRRHVTFQYCGYEITVYADGSILLDA